MTAPPRDIVVVGASAGGVEALVNLAAALPPALHASLFVVLHMAAEGRSTLPHILDRAGPLPAVAAEDGMAIRHGRIYVARPNYHLLLERPAQTAGLAGSGGEAAERAGRGRMRVLGGPRENGARPAIDPLFRSAAWAYGERVVGIVLSGTLDDGTAGLRAITRHGGLAVVQSDGLFGAMAQSALENTHVDHVLPVAEIGALIARLAALNAEETVGVDTPTTMGTRVTRVTTGSRGDGPMNDQLQDQLEDQMPKRAGEASGLTCPECNGSLWSSDDGLMYECRVDHRYTVDTLVAAKAQEVEASIWAAVNALEERASLLRKNAARVRGRGLGPPEVISRFDEQAREAEEHAEAIRRTLLGSLVAVGGGAGYAAETETVGGVQP
jgi:two-component system chemotaxis response regulator CheB